MSLYYEAADVLTAPTNVGGSLKSRIFSKDLKSQPSQLYALAVETCKWSPILKEVIENADLLRLERKLTPILSLLLVHDLLLAKKGIALPATHGLRTATERHKARLQAELTKARIRRKLGSLEDLKTHVEEWLEDGDTSDAPYPRWVRINTLKTSLEDQLDTTFAGYERAVTVDAVRQRGVTSIYIDAHIPNLVSVSHRNNLTKSEAYMSGAIIFQDKASCFPAYLLDPLPEDGDLIDTCAAPGNKTTHIAAIMIDHASHPEECSQTVHAFEKDKTRAQTLEKMVKLASSDTWTRIHPGQDFLKTNPDDPVFRNVGALLLDPSCSGSGIIGRDDMPQLHLPAIKEAGHPKKDVSKPSRENRKRKREEHDVQIMVDDEGLVTAVDTEEDLKVRLTALSTFQLDLLLHAFKFPAAKKITYSTCSVHAEENENVVRKALNSAIAKDRGWRLLKRDEQVRGMREWPVRGSREAGDNDDLAEACIRANKGDDQGTMGFFVAGFLREDRAPDHDDVFLRDDRGHLVRDIMGYPMRKDTEGRRSEDGADEDEWNGFEDDGELEHWQRTEGEDTHSIKEEADGNSAEMHIKNLAMEKKQKN